MCGCVTGIACTLKWGVAFIGDISTGLCSPRRGIPLSGTFEAVSMKRVGLWP